MSINFHKYLLKITEAFACQEKEVIQSLWSGYGSIARYRLVDSVYKSIVVKHISLGETEVHPRGWDTYKGHIRKVKSYEIETHWYEDWSLRCKPSSRIPKLIGAYAEGLDRWIVLEDLDSDFPLRKQQLDVAEVKVCLDWLANFHGTFLGHKPNGLWEVGSYWHLATRLEEWERIKHPALKKKATEIDNLLNNCTYQTIIHGDAKVANFCFSENGEHVAALDFQYVGGGCGMKDVAYFLGSCLSNEECEQYESELLDHYFTVLAKACDRNINLNALEKEWRNLYPVAVADFIRFMLGWMPTHVKVNAYSLKKVEAVLATL